MAGELKHTAAVLTAAFIQRGDLKTVEDAAVRYYECLAALRVARGAELQNRPNAKPPRGPRRRDEPGK
jgi:hypothetical protein